MKIESSMEITQFALKSNCSVCNKKIHPWQLWTYSETKRGSLIFAHDRCLFPKYYKKLDEKLKKRGDLIWFIVFLFLEKLLEKLDRE